jgi:rhamnosyltransferase
LNKVYNKKGLLAGSVILFNPEQDVLRNIASYVQKTDILYIIDNSSLKDDKLLHKIEQISTKCKLLVNPNNYGIAKALNQAVDLALNDGYEWLLTMDQDSHFADHLYFKTFQEYEYKNEISLFTPELIVFPEDLSPGKTIGYQPVFDTVMTSGSILNLTTCKLLGSFENKLFIDEVDTDYCFKLLKNRYKILKIKGTYLLHPQGYTKQINFPFNKKLRIVEHQPFRHYYITRNNLHIFFTYFQHLPWLSLKRLKVGFLYKNILGIVFHKKRFSVLKYSCRGFVDFIRGRYGPLLEPREKKVLLP